MKNVRMYVLATFISILFWIFIGFYFFGKNLQDTVGSKVYIPFKTVPMYTLLISGEVEMHIFNIIFYSLILSLPVFFILKILSKWITNRLIKKGNL